MPGTVEELDEGSFSQLDLSELIAELAEDEFRATFRERVPAEGGGAALPPDAADYDFWERMFRAAYRIDRDHPCPQIAVDK